VLINLAQPQTGLADREWQTTGPLPFDGPLTDWPLAITLNKLFSQTGRAETKKSRKQAAGSLHPDCLQSSSRG
jgi:hypothetical protein